MTKPWNHKKFKIEPLVGKQALPVLLEGSAHLEGKWWLSAGTLLGLVREGTFLPLDTDIDVNLIGNMDRSAPDSFMLVRTVDSDDGKKQYQTVWLHKDTNILFDINQYHPVGRNYVTRRDNEDEGGEEYLKTPKKLVDPLDHITANGHKLPVPAKIDEYLTLWYGNWREPDLKGKREWLTK